MPRPLKPTVCLASATEIIQLHVRKRWLRRERPRGDVFRRQLPSLDTFALCALSRDESRGSRCGNGFVLETVVGTRAAIAVVGRAVAVDVRAAQPTRAGVSRR